MNGSTYRSQASCGANPGSQCAKFNLKFTVSFTVKVNIVQKPAHTSAQQFNYVFEDLNPH